MNKHVEDYLEYYLSIISPKYAVAITGVWGCGKTFFVNNYIERWCQGSNNRKSYYITLNGLTSVDDIDCELFASMHPILSNKKIQFAGKIAKGLLKGMIRFDVDDSVNLTSRPSIDFGAKDFESISTNNNRVFIFDDLERCKLDKSEVLGYINYLVEHQGCSVIIIANMDKVKTDKATAKDETRDEDKKCDIEEKTIGQRFTVKGNINAFYDDFISNLSCNYMVSNYFFKVREKVLFEFEKTNVKSLRVLGGALRGLVRLYEKLNEVESFDSEWIDVVIPEYIHLSCEYNISKNEKVFLDYNAMVFSSYFGDDEGVESSVSGNYPGVKKLVFTHENIQKLIIESIVDVDALKIDLDGHFEDLKSGWYELYNFSGMKFDAIRPILDREIKELNHKKNRSVGSILHIVGIVRFFEINELIDIDFESFYKLALSNIKSLTYIEMKKEENSFCYEPGSTIAHSGCGYYSSDDAFFYEFINKCKMNYFDVSELHFNKKVDCFYDAVKNQKDETIREILNIEKGTCYKNVSALKFVDYDELLEVTLSTNRTFAINLMTGISNQVKGNENKDELKWLEGFKDKFNEAIQAEDEPFRRWVLKSMFDVLNK